MLLNFKINKLLIFLQILERYLPFKPKLQLTFKISLNDFTVILKITKVISIVFFIHEMHIVNV